MLYLQTVKIRNNMEYTIENKTTHLMLPGDVAAKYSDLVYTLINQPLKQGITTAEMRRDIRILDILDKAKTEETFLLKEEDLSYVISLMPTYQWQVRHYDLLAFEDYFTELLK